MNGKKARFIRNVTGTKLGRNDKNRITDYKVLVEKEIVVRDANGNPVVRKNESTGLTQVITLKRQSLLNASKYAYRRAKKNLAKSNLKNF